MSKPVDPATLQIIAMASRPGLPTVAVGAWVHPLPIPFGDGPYRVRPIRRVDPPPGGDPTWCYWEPGDWAYYDSDGSPLPDEATWRCKLYDWQVAHNEL